MNIFEKVFGNKRLGEKSKFPAGGIRRTICPDCGGFIHKTGKGILRDECSECGKVYREPRLG